MKKSGFTLAEVLVTLGIIGVIAAMTLPTVIANYQKHATVSQLKKAYSILQNANAMAEVDHGSSTTWYFESGNEYFEKFLIPYLKDVKFVKNYNPKGFYYYTSARISTNVYGVKDAYCLSNGICLWTPNGTFNIVNGKPKYNYFIIYCDLNGQRGPHRVGRDIFALFVYPDDYKISYYKYANAKRSSRDQIKASCNKDGTSWDNGVACVQLIANDNWKILDDYPW